MPETLEETIVDFSRSVQFEDLPVEVTRRQKELILDQLGVQIACSDLPWVQSLLGYAKSTYAPGPALVLGTSLRLSAEAAALVNGTGAHGFELDDYYPPSHTHPSCVAVPAALAMGEMLGSSGREVLIANALGSEMMVRIAHATNPSMLYERAFHATCAHGVFGSAVAAGRLLGLDAPSYIDALGIASSHASGTTEHSESGGDTKRLHGGLGAAGGIRAALLAQSGFRGARTSISGKKGFLVAFSPDPKPSWLAEFGTEWLMVNIATKPYCCNARITPQINALVAALEGRDVDLEDIVEIRVGTDQGAYTNRSADLGPEPDGILGMQFSTHVAMGLRAVTGSNGFDVFFDILNNSLKQQTQVTAVAHKVKVYADDESTSAWPKQRLAKVTVSLADGTTLHGRAVSSADSRPDGQQITEKFLGLATRKVSHDAAERIASMVLNLEELDDIRQIDNAALGLSDLALTPTQARSVASRTLTVTTLDHTLDTVVYESPRDWIRVELEGRTIIVAGAGRNSGREIALILARNGANLALIARQRREQLDAVASECEALGATVTPILADLTVPDEVNRAVATTEEQLGPVDTLVSVLAIRPHHHVVDTSYDEWHQVFAVNLHATFYLAKAVIPGMIERGFGNIIALGGVASLRAQPMRPGVVASKFALLGLIKSMALDLGDHGIRANMVAPGFIENKRANPEWYPEAVNGSTHTQAEIDRTPLRREGRPTEVAEAVLFLASERSAFITGESIACSGGRQL